jgi:hypothetical protein
MHANNKNQSLKTSPSLPSKPAKPRSVLPAFSLKKIGTLPSEPLPLGKAHLRYDTTLFHKTIFHLKPLHDNPEIFIRERALSSKALAALKEYRPRDPKAVLPHPIHMKLAATDCPNR